MAAANALRSELRPCLFRVRQITYAGHPLYTYSHDFGPGATLHIGTFQFGGTWDALTAAGQPAG